MNIEVLNCKDKRLEEYIHRAITFYGEQLISKRILNNICIDVSFDDDMTDLGGASIEGFNTAKKPRDFLIEISNKVGAKSVLMTLAHEMVHIKQYAYCETNEYLSKWKGVHIDSDAIDYYDLPWEIEAYGKEQGLFSGFVIKEKLWEVINDINIPDSPIEQEEMGWKVL